ncbi:MAG: cytochrome P450 [Calothrix sp. CSU_2_0]|nr:cytochrome P450 [Calothrix sp. CSU_2_0]
MTEQYVTQLETKTCPHLGKEFQPFINPQLDDPYSFFKRARKEEPIFYSSLFNAYVLTRYDDIITVLKDPTRFSSANSLQSIVNSTPEVIDVLRQGFPFVSLINSDGEQHKRLRAPFMKVFAPEQLTYVEASIRKISDRLLDGFINDGSAEIIEKFAHPIPLEVILTMYSVPLDIMPKVASWAKDMTQLFSSPLPPERQVECARSFVSLQNFVASLIEEKRKAPANDLITNILDSGLSTPELVLLLCEMIVAGHATSADFIATSIKLLAERPEVWQKLHQNPALIPAALEEVLRYDTPAPSMVRIAIAEVSIGEITIPQGSRILILYGSANRDETRYPDADKFNIERFQEAPVNHIAFSHGMHHCLGSSLARREGRIAIEVLSQRLPNLRLAPNQQLTHIPAMLNRGYTSLKVEWDIA